MDIKKYDIVIVGAGHAGCEAAAAAANLGSKTLLITMNLANLADMSCNPAVGGVAKGQIVREIDALGGYMGIVTDRTMIQFRMLNTSKGPAMWSPRAQSDKQQFSLEWRNILQGIDNLDFRQDTVVDFIIEDNVIKGVKTILGYKVEAKAVVLCNGTFLNGLIHVGEHQITGGRIGERSSKGLTQALVEIGFESKRMKTGTPVRIDGRSIDFSKMIEQPGDEDPQKFSFLDTPRLKKQRSCHLTYTNPEMHAVLKTGFDKSPMFKGRIEGIGPRYCPSIEDKINRFADKDQHQIFIEPEGWDTIEYYANGISSSLPEDVQFEAIRKIPGLENVKIFRPGYAIEYDFFPPQQLDYTLQTKRVQGLYFAGQINGTTGYEEAACQGMMAAINAHLKIVNQPPFVLKRSEAYIGVLIDDLINKGVNEPYRMFTSRAEYRILLRQNNADLRLSKKSYELGLASKERVELVDRKLREIAIIMEYVSETRIAIGSINPFLDSIGESLLKQGTRLKNLILRPRVKLSQLIEAVPDFKQFVLGNDFLEDSLLEAEVLLKYDRYIEKEREMVQKMKKMENIQIKADIDYRQLQSLSSEAREKLSLVRPQTIAQASRISGVSPSDVSVLLVYMGK